MTLVKPPRKGVFRRGESAEFLKQLDKERHCVVVSGFKGADHFFVTQKKPTLNENTIREALLKATCNDVEHVNSLTLEFDGKTWHIKTKKCLN
ncbi:MAG: hypothetical protein QW343_00745 [Candidatus Norongarragalinales archaeon]